jgi:hypothetical protein
MLLIKRDMETDVDRMCEPLTWRWGNDNTGHRFPIFFDTFGHGMPIGVEYKIKNRVYPPHNIAPDGTVSPSVVCIREGCTFHEFIKFGGYP